MKPLTDNMKRMLAVLAKHDGAGCGVAAPIDNRPTLLALESRGLCGSRVCYWEDDPRPGYYGELTDAGRKLAAELATMAEKGGAV